ncbi:MAG: PD-(D/E)XK nuclease family protein [Verrucomicrobiae bacterium]|nr:PD-(D/E)XK nuclease family protein [Verrucomicrobiae bacterium]
MPPRLLTAPTFPQLEHRLLGDLAEAVARDAFAPKWTIVPNATLANHLRGRFASLSSRTLGGVRVANLPLFAARLAEALLDEVPVRWRTLHELVLEERVAKLERDSPLAPLRRILRGASLLRDTFADLAHGGFGLEDLGKVRDLAQDSGFEERERAVLRLFADFAEDLGKRGIAWSPMTLQKLQAKIEEASEGEVAAALGAQAGQEATVFVHGFYEWLDVNLGWLAALAAKTPVRIYYPWRREVKGPHPAYAFAADIVEELERRFAFLETEKIEDAPGAAAKFFLDTFPEGKIAAPPEFFTWQRAAGPRAEAISAAVRVRSWIEEGLPPEEILVTAPVAEGYGDVLRTVFGEFGIPLRVTDLPAGVEPLDEALRHLARLWEEKAPAERVLALLRAGRRPPAAQGVDVDVFEKKVRALGIWGGAAWRAFAERSGEGAPSPAERRLLEAILGFAEDSRAPSAELSAGEARDVFARMAKDWLADRAALEGLLADTTAAAEGAKGLRLELREWATLLAGEAAEKTLRDPPSRSALFAPVMRARGITARGVVFLGLAAGAMPRRVEDHPFLSDAAWRRIARAAEQIGHRLPIKARVPDEMLLLFHLVNTSAERVHWVVPETDATGRAVAPTPWVPRYLHSWKNREPALFKERIPPSARLQADHLAKLDAEKGGWLPPAFALYLDPDLAEKLRGDGEDRRLAAAMAWRGIARNRSGGLDEPFSGDRLHVTNLGRLAECPFRFLCEKLEGLTPIEPLAAASALDPLRRGTWIHLLLEAFLRPHLGTKKLSEIAAEFLERDDAFLLREAAAVAQGNSELGFAYGLLPPVFRDGEARAVVEKARRYFRWASTRDGVPQAIEFEVEKEWPGRGGLRIVGKIDQIEQEPGGEAIVDFKSGKLPERGSYATALRLGWNVQASLYPWLRGGAPSEFRYVYLGEDEVKLGEAGGAPSAETLLAELKSFLDEGFYPPTSIETVAALAQLPEKDVPGCAFCKLASVCRKFEAEHAARHAALLDRDAPRRAAAIRRLAAGERAR